MVDETTDLSNTEQMVICLRYVADDQYVAEVLRPYSLELTKASPIVSCSG